MKRRLSSTAILISLALLISSCKKNNQPDCGCNAPTRTTIQESAKLTGTVKFSQDVDGKNLKDKFTIVHVESDCSNCVHTMVICNEAVLPQEVLNLKHNNQSLQVKFAGDLKPLCEKIFAPGDYTYENIFLSAIEVQ